MRTNLSDKMTSKVSVVIPVYGVEQYIADAVRSVLQQTYTNFELLIIDDGSPDRSIEICQQISDPRIKIIHQQNRGLSAARNTGIHHAEGEYIAFLDGDDLWLPEKLEKHVDHLESSAPVGVSFSRSAFIDETGNLLGTYQMPKLQEITVFSLLRSNPVGNGSAAVVRREVFEAIQFQANLDDSKESSYFDESFRQAEDIECWLRIKIQTPWTLEGIPEALTLYRVNSQGLSANLSRQFEIWQQVIEKTRTYAPELIAQGEATAKAYRLRYLARRAVRLKAGSVAVKFIHQAVAAHWRIVLEEPRPTLLTWAAAYLIWLLPRSVYLQIETLALNIVGTTQKRQIPSDQSIPQRA